jgi:hypothetical protein
MGGGPATAGCGNVNEMIAPGQLVLMNPSPGPWPEPALGRERPGPSPSDPSRTAKARLVSYARRVPSWMTFGQSLSPQAPPLPALYPVPVAISS